ncbi:MAG: dodecin family protein [Acidimicrobiia bacterium]
MHVTKTIRLAAGAGTIEEAISTILARASITMEGIRSFKIVEVGGTVDESGVAAEYQVTMDVTFVVKDTPQETPQG